MEEEWRPKGANLSDKTARKEFGLTQDEIESAIDAGQLQYRVGVVHGNPWLRLLRREVEDLMESIYNARDHRQRRAKAELARVDRDLKQLRAEVSALEEHRTRLLADVQVTPGPPRRANRSVRLGGASVVPTGPHDRSPQRRVIGLAKALGTRPGSRGPSCQRAVGGRCRC